jgi:opacity protein-like surface antigen
MRFIKYVLCAAALAASVQTASAQTPRLALEVRGGAALPTGDWNEDEELDTGFGFGANARAMVSPTMSVYAGYEMYMFPVDIEGLGDVDADIEDAGFRGGVAVGIPMANPGFAPYLELGVIYNTTTLSVSDGSTSGEVESERGFGFEAGVGVAVPLGPNLSITPALRYRSHEVEFEDVAEGNTTASYISLDIGLRLHL